MFMMSTAAKFTIVTLMVLSNCISLSWSWNPKCDPILLDAGDDAETKVKTDGSMIPGATLLKQDQFASHVANKKCAYFFGHSGGSAKTPKIASYSYLDLEPLILKYDRVHTFACNQDRQLIFADIAKTAVEEAMQNAGIKFNRRQFVVKFDGTTFSATAPSQGLNKDATKELKDPTFTSKAKIGETTAESRLKEIGKRLGFSANKVVNLHPCGSSLCAWLTPTDQEVEAMKIKSQDQKDITKAKDLGIQLIYRKPDNSHSKLKTWGDIKKDLEFQHKEQMRWIEEVFPKDMRDKISPKVRDVDLDKLDDKSDFLSLMP